jgi:GT2 family glycosyltransferase
MKIGIGIPTTGTIRTRTVVSLLSMVWNTPHPLHLIAHEGCYIHDTRVKMAKEAQNSGCSHLLFLDSDMWLAPDSIMKLLAHDKDIVGANYNKRELPLIGTAKLKKENGKHVNIPNDSMPDTLFQCDAIGTGFMLVKVPVFDKLEHPWFFFTTDGESGLAMGEDVWFCQQAKKAGFEIWCDPTIKVMHLGEYGY